MALVSVMLYVEADGSGYKIRVHEQRPGGKDRKYDHTNGYPSFDKATEALEVLAAEIQAS